MAPCVGPTCRGKNPKSANRRKTGDGGRDGTDGAQIPRSRGDESDGAAQSRTGWEPAGTPGRRQACCGRPPRWWRRAGKGNKGISTNAHDQDDHRCQNITSNIYCICMSFDTASSRLQKFASVTFCTTVQKKWITERNKEALRGSNLSTLSGLACSTTEWTTSAYSTASPSDMHRGGAMA